MEPVTFILGIASAVLVNVITDLITGKTTSARKEIIEKEVSDILLKKSQEQHETDLISIKRKVMDEIDILAARNPDLVISSEEIQLKRPVKKPVFKRDEAIRRELLVRLKSLDEIVLQRRQELGLPIAPEDTNSETLKTDSSSSISLERTTLVWKKTEPEQPPSRWAQEFMEMEARIRQRRSGDENHGDQ